MLRKSHTKGNLSSLDLSSMEAAQSGMLPPTAPVLTPVGSYEAMPFDDTSYVASDDDNSDDVQQAKIAHAGFLALTQLYQLPKASVTKSEEALISTMLHESTLDLTITLPAASRDSSDEDTTAYDQVSVSNAPPAKKPMTSGQFAAFAAAGDGSSDEMVVVFDYGCTISPTTQTVSSPSNDEVTHCGYDLASDDEEADGFIEYLTDANVLNAIDSDTSYVAPKASRRKASVDVLAEFCVRAGIEMPAADESKHVQMSTLDIKNLPLSPEHDRIEFRHHEMVSLYEKTGLFFSCRDQSKSLRQSRQRPTVSPTSLSESSSPRLFTAVTTDVADPDWLVQIRLGEALVKTISQMTHNKLF